MLVGWVERNAIPTVRTLPSMVGIATLHPSYAVPISVIYRAITTGIRDYVRKNGFSSVLLGLVRRD